MSRILVPPAPGILCALGQLVSDLRHDVAETHVGPYAAFDQATVDARLDGLLAKAKAAHKHRSQFQVWQEGFHPQAIYSDSTMIQKIDYVHANPVRRGWVASPEHWRYSSAHEWLPGAVPVLRCDAWR